jgi:hypothetical protein
MPVRIEELKNDFEMEFDPPIGTATRAVLLPDLGLTLRKMDGNEDRYVSDGRYFDTVVQLPNWKAEGLTELFGYEAPFFLDPQIDGQDPLDQAYVEFQLSIDGGTSYLVWDTVGLAWVPAVGPFAAVYNDVATIDEHIPTLPFGNPRQVRVKAHLVPGASGRQRPVLLNTYIYNRHKMDIFEDVARSMKRYLDGAIQVPMYFNADFQVPANYVVVEQDTPGLDVKISPTDIAVYNITTDPGRNTNLFASFDGDRRISLTSAQRGQIEVQFIGIPDVFITAEEFFQVSKIPSVVIFIDRIEQYVLIRANVPETERSISRGVGRLQFHRLYYKIFATVKVQSSLKREVSQMIESICRVLDWGDEFMSVANGDHYCVLGQTSETPEDRLGEGLFVCADKLILLGKCWLKGEVENEVNLKGSITNGLIPLVKFVDVSLGSDSQYTLSLPPYLRKVYRELQVIDQNS